MEPSPHGPLNRRRFIQLSLEAGGSLVIALAAPTALVGEVAVTQTCSVMPCPWVRIDATGEVTLLWDKSEMGQGVSTALPMILAEELDVDWHRVHTERAPTRQPYNTETGGSSSIPDSWHDLRLAGATVRTMLMMAAASSWRVGSQECRTELGEVIHDATGRRALYGSLLRRVATLSPPDPTTIQLKDPRSFRLIGTPVKRRDSLEKVNGRAVFGIDVQLPGLLIVSVLRCPSYEGRVSRVDDSDARKIPGVRQVLTLDPIPASLPGRVAVVADSTWSAMQGRKALKVEWDLGPNADFNTDTLWTTAREWVHQDSRAVPVKSDNSAGPPPRDSRLIEASYEVPFAAHACMEPMNCTADIQADCAEVWAPTQAPRGARESTAKLTGLPEDRVTIHVTYLGGGFGRRYYDDFVVEAVEISKRMAAPVKVIWTREEDVQHDIYRPAVLERFRAALDGSGLPIRWHNRIVAPSWRRWWHPGADNPERSDEADLPPYNISNVATDYIELPRAVPIGAWRSVKHSQNGFCLESFIDECAHAAGRDPLDYRIALLDGKPRQQAVLRLAAQKAGWGAALSRPRGRGVAFWNYGGTYVAEIAEVTLDSSQQVHVDRIVCAFDCGTIVNPDTVRAQIESAVGWGVSAALWGEVTVQGGRTHQSNFHDYRVLRINECPRIEIELVRNLEPPTGVGEPAVPPLAAAIANAVFAASGVRRRRLPLNVR